MSRRVQTIQEFKQFKSSNNSKMSRRVQTIHFRIRNVKKSSVSNNSVKYEITFWFIGILKSKQFYFKQFSLA